MRLEAKLLECLKLTSQEGPCEPSFFDEDKKEEILIGENPEVLYSYTKSSTDSSYLGKWAVTGQREIRVFLSLAEDSTRNLEAFVCEKSALTLQGKIVQQIKIVQRVAPDRIKGGINGSFSSQDLAVALKKTPHSFQAALHSPLSESSYFPSYSQLVAVNNTKASSCALYFLPRLDAAAGTIKERESLLRKLTGLQKNLQCKDCDQAIALDEFTWAVDIALKCDKDFLPGTEIFLCADSLAQLVLKDFDQLKEESLQKVYGIYIAVYNLLKTKDLLSSHGETLFTSLDYLRRYFLEKTYLKSLLTSAGSHSLLSKEAQQDKTASDIPLEKTSFKIPFQEWGKYLLLSIQACLQNLNTLKTGADSQEVTKKLSQLFQEGRQIYLQRAIRERVFFFYQQASHYAVLNYHLSNRHTHLSPIESLKELLSIQGAYIKENLGDCKDLVDFYKNKKCGSLNWQALSKKGKEGLIVEVERMADYLLTRGIHSAAYAFYRLGSDLSNRFSAEYMQDETQYVSHKEREVHRASRALGTETLEKSTFTHRKFSLAATDAFEKIIPSPLLEKEALFRKKLELIREKSAALIKDKTSLSQEEQKECTSFYCDLIKEIFHEGSLIFSTEKTPEYALVGIGSLSRGEMCPFSDIELVLIKQELSLKNQLKEQAKGNLRLSELIEKVEVLEQKEGLSFEQALQKQIQKEKQCRQTIEAILKKNAEEHIRLEELVHEEVRKQKAAVNNLELIHSTFLEEMELFEKREQKIPLERFLNWKKDQIDELTEKLSPESLEALKKASTDTKTELFYSQLSELFNLSIIALGESPAEFSVEPALQGALVTTGFHLDKDNNPLELRATAEEFALRQAQVEEVKSIQNNALRTTVFLTGNRTLHTEYQKTLEKVLNQENLRHRHAEANVQAYRSKTFESLESEEIVDVKQDLLRLPVFVFETLCLHYGMHAKDSATFFHTLDKIELLCEKGLFPSCLKEPFKEFLEFAFYLRFKVHLESGEENDKYQPSSVEKKQILHFHKLLVEPLKALLSEWGMSLDNEESIDLTSRIFFLFAKAYCNKAKDLLERNPPLEKTLPYLEKALLIQERPEIYFLLGKVYFLQNDFIQAHKAWQKIIPVETTLGFTTQSSNEEVFYLQKEKLAELIAFAEEQAKTAALLEQTFPFLEQDLKKQAEKNEKEAFPTTPSFGGNTPAFHELFLKLVQIGKTPILQDRLKHGLGLFLQQEIQKGESQAKKSVLEKLQPLYFALPQCYQREWKELLRTTFSDKTFLFEQFLTEEGYPFAAMVRKQRWMQSLSRWKKDKLASGEKPLPLIEGISLEKGYLLGSVAHDLFEGKQFKNAIQWGNRAVTQAVGTHFKKNPESPGDEYAVFLLNHLITGQGSPPVEIMKAVVSKEEHLLLASETVEIEPLHLFFSTYGEYLDRIDKKQFSQMVLMALLTDPEDGKADNYIASYVRDAKGDIQNIRLIGVDNDHVFVKPFVQKGLVSQDQLFIKTILFCFDQMKGEFHPEVREEFLRLDPSRVLESWLEGLIVYNKKIESLFSEETLDTYWKNGTLVPFFMHPDQLLYLHEKMLRIQHFFSKGVKNHLELLKRLDARVGELYETALLQPLSPKKRFEMLTKDAYQRRAHASFTLTTTAQIKKYTLKSNLDKIAHFKGQSFTPEEGLKALKILVEAKQHKEQAQLQIDNSWETMDFRRLLTVPLQEKMLKEKDWSQAPVSHLAKLEKIPFRKAFLKNYEALQDLDLERFLKTCIHPITEAIEIQTLDLRGCKSLTSKSVGIISANCPRLQKLNLASTGIKEASFSLKQTPYLRSLSLRNCSHLNSLIVKQNELKVLILEGCSQLKTLTLDCPELIFFQVKGCKPSNKYAFSEKTPISSALFTLLLRFIQERNPPFKEFLEMNVVNPKTLKIFSEAFHANKSFITLKIDLNGSEPFAFSLFDSLQFKAHPVFSYLQINGVRNEHISDLTKALSNLSPLVAVHFINFKINQNEAFAKGFSQASFSKLQLTGKVEKNQELLLAWAQNKSLTTIDLTWASLTDDFDISILASSPTLEALYLPNDFYAYKDSSNQTLLHFAVAVGNKKLCSFFLSRGVEVNTRDNKGNTPLQIAISLKKEELSSFLIDEGGLTKEYKLHRGNYSELLEYLLEDRLKYGSYLDVSFLKPEDYSLFFQALANNTGIVGLRFSPDQEDSSLQKTNTTVSASEGSKLYEESQDFIVDRWSLSSIKDLSKQLSDLIGKNAALKVLDLRECTFFTGEDISILLHKNTSKAIKVSPSLISYQDSENRSLLHLAVLAGNKRAVQNFVNQGGDFTLKDKLGRTPLDLALSLGHKEIATVLKRDISLQGIAFGKREWERYFGDVGSEPPLPLNIHQIFQSRCPFFPGKKVGETHFLTLIPRTVNGKLLTLDYLEELIQNPKRGGHATRLISRIEKNTFALNPPESSYWILLTKDILPGLTDAPYDMLCRMLQGWKKKSWEFNLADYRAPKALEVAVSIFMEYVKSGIGFYSTPEGVNGKWTSTFCEEKTNTEKQLVIGDFDTSGLHLHTIAGKAGIGVGLGAACEVSENL